MIIGVTGLKQSGKDTFFNRAVKIADDLGLPEPEKKSFAGLLKDSVAALFDISHAGIEKFKTDPNIRVQIVDDEADVVISDFSFRQILQRYGTEAHRDIFGSDFWVDRCLPTSMDHSGRLIVVTDTRFDNERARIVRDMGGIIVKMLGGDDDGDSHPSENITLDADFTIDNSVRGDNFASLDLKVTDILQSIDIGA